MTSKLRDLPSVDSVLMNKRVQALTKTFSHNMVVRLVREGLDRARANVIGGCDPPSVDALAGDVIQLASSWHTWPTPLINATGVILHTNLGRAPLSEEAVKAAHAAAESYTDLEYALDTGNRGSRQSKIGELISHVTGADAALVVNNNASAVLLGLIALSAGRQVIVSRGEAVEIGGGFRIPEMLGHSGAELVEVGTTNRTYLHDFEAAISEKTGAILAVHASNFRTVGFTHSSSITELVKLGSKHNLPVLHDLGSGCLLETTAYGLVHEPMPQESLAAGVDLTFFSGDKLLGGPQAGLIAGKTDAIVRLAKHPVARAVRTDKMSLAALAATLLHYMRGEAVTKVPVWKMISVSPDCIRKRANQWSEIVGVQSSVVESKSTVGGGSLPGATLPTFVLSVAPGIQGADRLAAVLRNGPIPVVTRIEDDRVMLDPRTVLPSQEQPLLNALVASLTNE